MAAGLEERGAHSKLGEKSEQTQCLREVQGLCRKQREAGWLGDIRCPKNEDVGSLRARKPFAVCSESGGATRRGSVGKSSH